MKKSFEDTISNRTTFNLYGSAMSAIVQGTYIIAERGADPEGVILILRAIDRFTAQLRHAGDKLERREMVENLLREIQNKDGNK